jgi:hypothetical protein
MSEPMQCDWFCTIRFAAEIKNKINGIHIIAKKTVKVHIPTLVSSLPNKLISHLTSG